jgi:type IV pilus assembly protein PilV
MTLIEILVAMVVLSIGLLGLAGLQLKGLQVNQGSTYRSQAALLVEDIADRMRADRGSALGGNYNLNNAATAPAGAPAALTEWLARLSALPGGAVTIGPLGVGAAPNSVTIPITVSWTDTRAQGGSGLSSSNAGYGALGTYTVTMEL